MGYGLGLDWKLCKYHGYTVKQTHHWPCFPNHKASLQEPLSPQKLLSKLLGGILMSFMDVSGWVPIRTQIFGMPLNC